MAVNDYDPYVRKPYEFQVALAWAVACLWCGYLVLFRTGWDFLALPTAGYAGLSALSVAKGLRLLGRGKDGALLSFMPAHRLIKKMKPGRLWFGWGFDWGLDHAQRALDTLLSGTKHKARQELPGSPWIHGLNKGKEADIQIPLKSLEGHTLLFGTTGSGKTRAFELMIAQAVARGDTVIVIDPKGDKELKDRMVKECQRAGRDDAFLFFHPAFPSSSIRINPMRNFNRPTELASRIAALLPSSSGNSDAFTAFGFRTLTSIAQGLMEIDKRPSLRRLRHHIEGGSEGLLVQAIKGHAGRIDPDWEASAMPYLVKARAGKARKLETISNPDWLGIIEWYRSELSGTAKGSEAIDGLLSLVEHNRLHFSKMIASLIPVLVMLTSGEMGNLLSPDEIDAEERRPVYDTSNIIGGKHVLYVGLDALSDSIVSSAIGSILLADFASVAGMIYNRGKDYGRITLFVDEAAEVVNLPFVQILNKGRGAGFQVVMATQTLPDIVARLGDEAKARQVIGNCNNLITLRIKDGETQKYVIEAFGETYVRTVEHSLSNNANARDNISTYSGGTGQRLSYAEKELFPQHLLGQLPNFHYVASIAGGRVIKGRLPIID